MYTREKRDKSKKYIKLGKKQINREIVETNLVVPRASLSRKDLPLRVVIPELLPGFFFFFGGMLDNMTRTRNGKFKIGWV